MHYIAYNVEDTIIKRIPDCTATKEFETGTNMSYIMTINNAGMDNDKFMNRDVIANFIENLLIEYYNRVHYTEKKDCGDYYSYYYVVSDVDFAYIEVKFYYNRDFYHKDNIYYIQSFTIEIGDKYINCIITPEMVKNSDNKRKDI